MATNIVNVGVDNYLEQGCGRCALAATPQCKAIVRGKEQRLLRATLLGTPLTETLKWSLPCYTFNDANVAMLYAFKDFSAVSFFKGVLLTDPHHLLELPGENSQSGKFMKFRSMEEVRQRAEILLDYIHEAIEIENAGLKVKFKDISEYGIPEEFQQKMIEMPALAAAFQALTPGRQKSYLLHFAGAKQAATRRARVEKYVNKILKGQGFHD